MATDTKFLAKYPTYSALDEQDLQVLSELTISKDYAKDEMVFQEEAKGDSMYIISKGSVKVVKKVKNQEHIITVIKAGEFFGEMAIVDGDPRSAGVKAAEPTTALMLSDKGYAKMRSDRPKTALKIMDILIRLLSKRLRATNKNLEVIQFWIE